MTAFSPAAHRFGDVSVRLSVELGRTDMPLRDVLALAQGSVVPLNRLTDELLDLTANGKVIARGEVIAQDGKFALRIVSLAGDEAPGASGASGMASPEPLADAPANAPVNAPVNAPADVPIPRASNPPQEPAQ